jgi:hypothetical protein
MVMQIQSTFPIDVDVSDVLIKVYTMVIESETSIKTIR